MLLLALYLLPAASPLFAMGDDAADAGVPACCRRNGKHHCMMSMAERAQSAETQGPRGPQLGTMQEKCPYCPAAMSVLPHFEVGGVPLAGLAWVRWYAHPLGRVQTECRRRLARDRARQKRGPPTNFHA